MGARTVGEPERPATALYVTRQRTGDHDGSVNMQAVRDEVGPLMEPQDVSLLTRVNLEGLLQE